MKKILLSLAVLCVAYGHIWAQQKTVTGTVKSAEDDGTLPGASVILKGTSNGTVTDIDGRYTLTIPEGGGTLVFSFVGLATEEVAIGDRSIIDISLAPDVQQLSEVVVTALGITREKRSLGYSVQALDGEAVSAVKDGNVVNSLSGKVAGVQVTGSTGTVGGSSRIIIRGVNSINGNNQPLFVVDGTPIDNSNFNTVGTQRGGGGIDFGNAVADINPDDIASVSVLKGANAAALYGSRAANGVILITTKKGESRKGLGVTYNTAVTFNSAAILPEYQNEYGGGYKQTFDLVDGEPVVNYAADESWGPRMDGTPVRQWYSWYPDDPDFGQLTPFSPHPDNVKDFFETGLTTNNSVAISGGNETTLFRASYTNFRQTGIIPLTELKRNTVAVNASTKLAKKLTVSASVNIVNTDNDNIPGQGYGNNAGNVVTSFNQWFQRQIDIDKLRNYQTADGVDRTWNISATDNLDPLYWENPYYVLNNSTTDLERQRVFGNMSARFEIMEGLSVQGWVRSDFYTDRRQERIASGSIPQDYYGETVYQLRENNYEFLAQYVKNIGDNISLSVNLGANSRRQKRETNSANTVGGLSVPNFFNIEASIDRPAITDFTSEKIVNSIYGSSSIGYKGMVFVDLSLRNDWSSTLPSNNNSYLYPAITGSFLFSELLNSDIISLGKVRASWSQVGNDTNPYRLGITYSSQNNYGSNPAYAVPNTINNSRLKPETVTSKEVGLEMNFLQGRLGFDVTYYSIEAEDQIIDLDVSSTSGFSAAYVNAGLLTNEGVELMLTGSPLVGQFTWDVAFNWAKNTNEVVELAEGLDNYQLASWGPSINARVGQPYGTWVTDGFEYHENGQPIVDNGLFRRATNQTYGTYLPEWTGGITNTFGFKGIRASVLVDFQNGGQLYSVSNRYGTYSGLLAETVGTNPQGNPIRDAVSDGGGVLANGVNEDGTPNTTYVDAQSYFKHLRTRREYFLYDASFVKLREVRIGYSLPSNLFGNLPIEAVEVAFVGRNLAILHKNVPNVDPESAYGSGNIQGFENGQHPSTRSLGFSLNFKF